MCFDGVGRSDEDDEEATASRSVYPDYDLDQELE